MELKLKLKYLGVVLFLFAVLIVIDWYKNIDYSAVYDEEIKEDIPLSDHHKYSKDWDLKSNQKYYFYNVNSIKKTKTTIPFVFNREIMSSTKKTILMSPHQ